MSIRKADYRELGGQYDLVVADPPYDLDIDVEHLFALAKGVLLIFASYKSLPEVLQKAGDRYRGLLVWDKRAGSGLSARGSVLATTTDFVVYCPQPGFTFPNGRPTNLISLPSIPYRMRVHEWQKPAPLIVWLVETFTKEGDTILDPFAGSGTTRVAELLGRKVFLSDIRGSDPILPRAVKGRSRRHGTVASLEREALELRGASVAAEVR